VSARSLSLKRQQGVNLEGNDMTGREVLIRAMLLLEMWKATAFCYPHGHEAYAKACALECAASLSS